MRILTDEEIQNLPFTEALEKVTKMWIKQKEKSKLADELLAECEVLETEMVRLLRKAEEKNPEDYKEFCESFGKEKENENVGNI